jgi:hypothetical protein
VSDKAVWREFLDKIVEALDDLSIGDLTEYGCLERIRRLVDQELAARRKASA